jgi:pyrroline-5-carboxylate reductase
MKISFIGYGNLAKAIAKSLQQEKNHQLFAASPSLKAEMNADGVTTNPDNKAIISKANLIILAVKPSQAKDVLKEIALDFPSDSLLVSVVAGVPLSFLAEYCRIDQAIVRTMPNIAIAVGKGAIPLIANARVTEEHKQWAENLFQHAGLTHWTDQEEEMNAFTALSGSGLAYVFLFMEAMVAAAQKLGLSKEVATQFSLQTLDGALTLAKTTPVEIAQLRAQVTSPAGTTAAALYVFKEHNFEKLISEAMEAAHKRAEELGKVKIP